MVRFLQNFITQLVYEEFENFLISRAYVILLDVFSGKDQACLLLAKWRINVGVIYLVLGVN